MREALINVRLLVGKLEILTTAIMSLIRVKDKYQLTLPAELREESGLKVGDIVDAKWEHGKIVLTPKSVVDRIPQALKEIRNEAKRHGLNKLSMEEIDAEVAATRSGQRRKRDSTRRSA